MNVPELERQICRIGIPFLEKAVWVLGILFVLGVLYLIFRIQDII